MDKQSQVGKKLVSQLPRGSLELAVTFGPSGLASLSLRHRKTKCLVLETPVHPPQFLHDWYMQ